MKTKNTNSRKTAKAKVALVSLGCPKNLVDLQVIGAELIKAGFDVGVPESEAEVIVVNTCAFIESARQEAVDAIEEACSRKHGKGAKCRAVIVTGCLPQRYKGNIFQACPEVDAIAGVDDLDALPTIVDQILARNGEISHIQGVSADKSVRLFPCPSKPLILTSGPFAYVKIGEGCRHACAFCAIPGIRGRLRSRPVKDIEREVKTLLSKGIREICIVAQDVTSYGMDFKDGTSLTSLLKTLDTIEGKFWIRLLYGHPAKLTNELLDFVSTSEHVLPYFDIPLQHCSASVLKLMDRNDTINLVPNMCDRIRSKIPNAVIRTTMLVGFPGETDADAKELVEFVKQQRFDHLGAFVFSPEEGTKAYDMPNLPSESVTEKRRDKVMRAQRKVVDLRVQELIGSDCEVLLEASPEANGTNAWSGRTARQAPDDIDGVTYVFNVPDSAKAGDFVNCRIVDSDEYDLIADCSAVLE